MAAAGVAAEAAGLVARRHTTTPDSAAAELEQPEEVAAPDAMAA